MEFHVIRFRFIIHEVLDIKKPFVTSSRNAWTRIAVVCGASYLGKFLNFFSARSKWFPVSIGDNGLNLCISQWPGNKTRFNATAAYPLTPLPTKFGVQKSAENYSSRCFGTKICIIFQRVTVTTRSITHSCWCNWTTFGKKTQWENHQDGLVLALQCPPPPGTCNPKETFLPGFPLSWSPTLFSGSGPVGITTCSLDGRNNWKVAIFRPKRK